MEKVVITAPAFTMSAAPHWIALDKGLFREEGLEVELVFIGHEREPRFQGSLVFQAPGGPAALFDQRDGKEIRHRNIVCLMKRPAHVLVARPEVMSTAELKGKRIIVAFRGTSWLDARTALRQFGLDPDRDVTWVPSEDVPPDTERARLEMVAQGKAEAVCSGPPHWKLAERMGLRRLPSARDITTMAGDGLATTLDVIQKHPEVVRAVVRALVRGAEFARLFKEETLDILQRHIIYVDRATLSECYDAIHHDWGLVTEKGEYLKQVERCCLEYKLAQRPLEDYFDLRFGLEAAREFGVLS